MAARVAGFCVAHYAQVARLGVEDEDVPVGLKRAVDIGGQDDVRPRVIADRGVEEHAPEILADGLRIEGFSVTLAADAGAPAELAAADLLVDAEVPIPGRYVAHHPRE